LNVRWKESVERAIAASTGRSSAIVGSIACAGGCIHHASIVELADARRYFIKRSEVARSGMFAAEADGLRALGNVGSIRVPRVIAVADPDAPGDCESQPFLVLEAIETSEAPRSFHREFGRRLAELHAAARGDTFGFSRGNWIGSTPQPNPSTKDWVDFWRIARLGHQLSLVRRRYPRDDEIQRLGTKLLDRLDRIISEPDEAPTLLHGDLWSGNYLVDENGSPVLIDPAVYWGRREADLAMTRLFGGFPRDFYEGYEETWPLEPGSDVRMAIYGLYHLLNHLVIFGTGYREPCLAVLRSHANAHES
jgi:protein-ribulosamine 3-kinase